MSSVTLFKQYLKENTRKKENLSFYHYLCFFCPKDSLLSTAVIQRFFQKALLFSYWQSRIGALKQNLIEEIRAFSKLYGPVPVDMDSFAQVDRWQWVHVQNEAERLNIVRLYLKNYHKKQDKIKVLPGQGQKTLALILEPTGQLKVLSFGPLFLIEQGNIRPLTVLSYLTYNKQYELAMEVPQRLEIKLGHFIHFRSQGEKRVTGQGSQGFCFHPAEKFQQQNIKKLSFLFLPLKRLENLFIEPSSDPDYQELIRTLSQSYHKLLTDPYNVDLKAELALFQARKALKNLYPQNSLLLLLTANIEYHLRKIRQAPLEGEEAKIPPPYLVGPE